MAEDGRKVFAAEQFHAGKQGQRDFPAGELFIHLGNGPANLAGPLRETGIGSGTMRGADHPPDAGPSGLPGHFKGNIDGFCPVVKPREQMRV